MAKKTISITEGRKSLFKIAEEVQKPNTYYKFTVGGKPTAVIMSSDEFDSIMETMELLSDPEALKNIEKAEKEYKSGKYYAWDVLKKELGFDREQCFVYNESKKKYKTKKK